MSVGGLSASKIKRVIALLKMQGKVLASGGADPEVLWLYDSLISYLGDLSRKEIEGILRASQLKKQRFGGASINQDYNIQPFEAEALSINEVARMVSDDSVSRRALEIIAIHRFRVPKGSMRSFHNKAMLREKILTLVENERTHEAISNVVRHRAEPDHSV